MTNDERINQLRNRLSPDMHAAIRTGLETGRFPRSLTTAFLAASVATMNSGDALESTATSPDTLSALEAIVLLTGRPPLVIHNDAVVLEAMPELPAETPALIRGVEKWIPSVGRIEFHNHDMSWGGTGWVAETRGGGVSVVVTNRHVARLVANRKANGSAVFMRAPSGARYGAAIDFREEVNSQPDDASRTAELTRIEYLADNTSADVALLLIEAAGFPIPDPLRLIDSGDAVKKGDLVALIGYPAYDSRNDADAQARYFRDLYEVKRFAPGHILQSAGTGAVLTYDCTSLGGNSGSPLLRLEDGKIVGLHFSGVYGKANSAVPAATIRALLKGERPVSVVLQQGREEAKDGSHPVEHFKGREGFNTSFLTIERDGSALETPWPTPRADLAEGLAQPTDNPPEPNELRYTHFGVKYSSTLKLPLVTAVNIDGVGSVRIKRDADQWFADERIPRQDQLGSANFQDAEIDRGHMVRREDPNWGTMVEAKVANDDTFHYVNAAAQHSRLNQGKALWQGLENYILDNARTHGFKACVFTGPVMRNPLSDEDENVIDGAVVPREFWKVVVTLDASGEALHATAYLLSQGELIRDLLEKRSRHEAIEGFELGPYRTFQLAISDLADATGYDFSAYIGNDPLAKTEAGQEALESGEPVALSIDEWSDIRL